MIVVDASVAVKWLLAEPGGTAARQLIFEGQRMYAPALIRLEVAGARLRRFREKVVPAELARAALAEWKKILSEGLIQLVADDELFDLATALSFKMQHALADCLYVAAAKVLEADLVTADRPMHERGVKVFNRIRLLEVGKDG